ncbi:MAG: serine/threonine protein kinase [Desulfosarcinaceae bacterium]|jgi:serine/threonine protein kinase
MVAETTRLPRTYGRYQIQSELGRGAMGVVYKAHDPQIDRWVALKVLRRGRTSGERDRKRFLKEAHAIGRLSHPNIVTVFDVGQDHGTVFLAEEYVDGEPLNTSLKRGALAPAAVVSMGIQLALALAYAHAEGIVHRDIKSYNIICQPNGRFKLTDFGIARIEDARGAEATQPGQIVGTPAYMAPELINGAVADGRSDLFSLGVVLYEAATGRRPFRGDTLVAVFAAIREKQPPAPHQLNPHVPAHLSDIIMSCLAKQPTERLQSGQDLVDALRTCLPDTLTGSPPPGPQTLPAGRRRRLLALILAAAGLIVAISLWVFVKGWGDLPASSTAPVQRVRVEIKSEPEGALVFINGQRKGRTPLTLRLAKDQYQLHLEASGYYDHTATLTIEDDRSGPVEIKLNPLIF